MPELIIIALIVAGVVASAMRSLAKGFGNLVGDAREHDLDPGCLSGGAK